MTRLLIFAGLWWLLAGYDRSSWWIGAPAVLVAAWISRRAFVANPRLSGMAGFLVYFLRGSVAGGIDVASRILRPSLPIRPRFLRYRLRGDENEIPEQLFLATISLLPGTLAVASRERSVTVHMLHGDIASSDRLVRLEARARAVFPSAETS